jgi:F0F1-type ATP synthase assembly protein I
MLGGLRGSRKSRDSDEELGDPQAEQQRREQAAAYQGATEAVFAIVIAVGLGYWADDYFETTPRYILVGIALGLGAFIVRVLRMRPDDAESAEATDTADSTEPNSNGPEQREKRDGKRE